jgi:hypothetical protein
MGAQDPLVEESCAERQAARRSTRYTLTGCLISATTVSPSWTLMP